MKPAISKAKKYIDKIKKSLSRRKPHLSYAREQEIIDKIRKTRERIWEERLAARS